MTGIAPAPDGAEAISLRVATFNLRHGRVGARLPCIPWRLTRGVAMLDAEICGLQEVDRWVIRSWFMDQLSWSRRALAATDQAFAHARWFGPAGRYGNGLVVRGVITAQLTLPLPVDGRRERRSAVWAEVKVAGTSVTVVNTHLQNHEVEARHQLRYLVGRLDGTEGPVVLMGDLNLDPGPVAEILGPHGFTIAGGPNSSDVDQPRRRIDHIAVRGATIGAVRVPRPPVSDHRPVIADIVIGGPIPPTGT